LAKAAFRSEHHFLAEPLLPFDLRQQHLFPPVGAVHVAGPQLGCQTVTLAVEQQQRVIAGGLKVAVVGAVLLLAVDRNLVESMSNTTRWGEPTLSAWQSTPD